MIIIIWLLLFQINKKDIRNNLLNISIFKKITKIFNKENNILNENQRSEFNLIKNSKNNKLLDGMKLIFNKLFDRKYKKKNNKVQYKSFFSKLDNKIDRQNIPLYINQNKIENSRIPKFDFHKNKIVQIKIKFKITKIERKIKIKRPNFKLFEIMELKE